MPMPLMLFAAGLGTRMRPLTDDRPKPLVQVAGRTLLDHALALADAAGAAPVVVNLHYRAEMIRAHLAGRSDVTLSDESARLLDTGGGLRRALPALGPGAVMTLNTDAVWAGPNPLAELGSAWAGMRGVEALLLLVPRPSARGHAGAGDFDLGPGGRLRRGGGYVYTGAQVLVTAGLAAIPDAVFSLNRLWDAMLSRGTLRGMVYSGLWCDVGRPASIGVAEAMLAEVHPHGDGDV